MLWPPQLDDLKAELNRSRSDTIDDAQLQIDLDAAVAYVEAERFGDFNFAGTTTSTLPAVDAAVFYGTLRLAVRWWHRRRSPEGVVDLGEFGTSRVARVDSDLERQLGIGAYRRPMV